MAFRVIRSRSRIVCVTPLRIGCRPVISADRVGAHVGATRNLVNRVLLSYSESRFGVRIHGCPCRPTGPYPWSSVMTRMIFGRDAARSAANRIGATVAITRSAAMCRREWVMSGFSPVLKLATGQRVTRCRVTLPLWKESDGPCDSSGFNTSTGLLEKVREHSGRTTLRIRIRHDSFSPQVGLAGQLALLR